jgi:carbamate kinase
MYDDNGNLIGAEVVIDKDRAGALLAAEIEADLLVLATDVDGVYLNWQTPEMVKLEQISPEALRKVDFPPGSMAPKAEAAAAFVEKTGRAAVIGALKDLAALVTGEAGTRVRMA